MLNHAAVLGAVKAASLRSAAASRGASGLDRACGQCRLAITRWPQHPPRNLSESLPHPELDLQHILGVLEQRLLTLDHHEGLHLDLSQIHRQRGSILGPGTIVAVSCTRARSAGCRVTVVPGASSEP